MPRSSLPETIRLPIQPPLNGVSRSFARGNQPAGTCWDALNMLPRDRQFRHRVSMRPGVGLQDDLETDAPVRLLHTASFATGPATGGTEVWNEPFTYTNGTLAGKGGWTSESGNWSILSNNAVSTALTTQSNLNQTDLAAWDTTQSYEFTIIFSVNGSTGTGTVLNFGWGDDAADPQVEGDFVFATDSSLGAGFDQNVTFQASKWNGVGNSLSAGYEDDGFTFGTPHTLTITRASTTITCKLDGVTIATVTAADDISTNPFFRLYCSDDENVVTVSSIVLTSGGSGDMNISRTNLKLVACSDTDTFIGTPAAMAAVSNSGTYPIDDASLFVSAATLFGFTYIVDGTSIRKLNLDTAAFVAYAATAGSAPTGCTIAVGWRGRLILSGSDDDPQNIFAARVGTPTDWDYGVDDDPAAAWAANLAPSGRVGQPVLALIPISDDLLIVGCEQSMWCVRGDPADGGSIDLITDTAGISGPNAWCRVADGSVYFVGPGGFFRLGPDGSFAGRVDDTAYPQYFVNFDRFTNHCTLVFDIERNAVWVYAAPEVVDDAPSTSLYYDLELKGFWPTEFTNVTDAGPLSAVLWDGFGGDARYIVLGGYTGQLYWQSRNRTADATSGAIVAYVTIGPYSLSSVDDATLVRFDLTGGEVASNGETDSTWRIDWTVQGGPTANSVTEGTPAHTATGTFSTQGHQMTNYPRTRGGWFTIKLANSTVNKYFVVENATLHILPSGLQR